MKLLQKERQLNDSGGKQNSASLKVRNLTKDHVYVYIYMFYTFMEIFI